MNIVRLAAKTLYWAGVALIAPSGPGARLVALSQELDPRCWQHWAESHLYCPYAHLKCPTCGGDVCSGVFAPARRARRDS